MCFGGSSQPKQPKMPKPPPLPPVPEAPPPPPKPAPAPQQVAQVAQPSTIAIGSSRRGDGGASAKRRGVGSLRINSGINTGSDGGVNL